MPLFGKRRPAVTTSGSGYEAPPLEQMRDQPASGVMPHAGLTPDDVRSVAFSKPAIGKRGYNEDEVDAFLDRVEEALRNPRASTLTAADVRGVAFNKPPIGRRGYNEDEVDAFLDRVEKELQQRR